MDDRVQFFAETESVKPIRPTLVVPAIVLGVVIALSSATSASAHDDLIFSNPAADSTVDTELSSVDLTLSQDLLDTDTASGSFAIQVVGPDNRFYNVGCISLEGSSVSTAVALGESGAYTVNWQVVSSDAHPTTGAFAFTYTQPAGVESAAGSTTGITCDPSTGLAITPGPEPTLSASPEASTAPEGTPTPEDAPPFPWLIVVAGAGFAALAAVGIIVGRRRRPKSDPDQ